MFVALNVQDGCKLVREFCKTHGRWEFFTIHGLWYTHVRCSHNVYLLAHVQISQHISPTPVFTSISLFCIHFHFHTHTHTHIPSHPHSHTHTHTHTLTHSDFSSSIQSFQIHHNLIQSPLLITSDIMIHCFLGFYLKNVPANSKQSNFILIPIVLIYPVS